MLQKYIFLYNKNVLHSFFPEEALEVASVGIVCNLPLDLTSQFRMLSWQNRTASVDDRTREVGLEVRYANLPRSSAKDGAPFRCGTIQKAVS